MSLLDDNLRERVFRIQPGEGPQAVCLTAAVDLDIASEARAAAELTDALTPGECAGCLVDVSGVFVDVRGLSVLLTAARRARALDIRFAVVPSGSLRTICRAVPVDSALVLLDGPQDPRRT